MAGNLGTGIGRESRHPEHRGRRDQSDHDEGRPEIAGTERLAAVMGVHGLEREGADGDANAERELLRHFAQRPGMPVARHELVADDSNGTERAIDVQINRLRRKIESDPANPVYLQTVRGKGYILYTD